MSAAGAAAGSAATWGGWRRNLPVLERVALGFVALIFWTEMDIAGRPLYVERAAYNDVWYLALVALLLVLGIAYRSVALPFGVWLLSAIGGEDALYFYLQFRAVPARLPWLDGHSLIWQPPTNVSVTAGLVVGTVSLVVLLLIENRWLARARRGAGGVPTGAAPASSAGSADETDRPPD